MLFIVTFCTIGVCHCVAAKDENKQKEAGFGRFLKNDSKQVGKEKISFTHKIEQASSCDTLPLPDPSLGKKKTL